MDVLVTEDGEWVHRMKKEALREEKSK